MKLTPRLQKIADEIKPGETMADIGTDHGFLPLFLWEQGISPQVIMADISKGSLDKAAENCRLLAPDTDFDLRLGSGLEVLAPAEVDTVVMAGIGGNLICELLGKDLQNHGRFPNTSCSRAAISADCAFGCTITASVSRMSSSSARASLSVRC